MPDRFIKLIRDRVGDDADRVIYKRATFNHEDFRWALAEKLCEESREYLDAVQNLGIAETWDELIDVYEVIWALCDLHGKTIKELASDAESVRLAKGSFLNRMSMWIRRDSPKV